MGTCERQAQNICSQFRTSPDCSVIHRTDLGIAIDLLAGDGLLAVQSYLRVAQLNAVKQQREATRSSVMLTYASSLDGVGMARFEEDRIQQMVLNELISAFMAGNPVPTIRELARRVHSVESRIKTALDSLEDYEYIERDRDADGKSIPRAIRLIKMPRTRFIPLVGRIAAGKPIPVYGENVEEYVPLPATQIRGAYAVRVRGDSMVGDNIIDGDCVIVTQDSEPNSGEMVIALINGEATVKRLRREGELIRLESSNPDQEKFPPIFVDYHDNSEIQGRVVGVIRWLK
jgi:repressor LexA